MKLDLKSLVKTDIVKGLNISKLAEQSVKSALKGAAGQAASMVAGNKEIQAQAAKVAEEQAVAASANKLVEFYRKNKALVFGGAGAVVLLGVVIFVRGLMPKRR